MHINLTQRTGFRQQGFTLLEMIICLSTVVIILSIGMHAWQDMIPRYQIRTAAANIHNLIQKARSDAISDGNQMICDGQRGCSSFGKTRLLWMGHDRNQDGKLSASEIKEYYQLPTGANLVWKRFRGNHLKFYNRGISRFQNGSFYICNHKAARRIVMNWIGRSRVETAAPDDCL